MLFFIATVSSAAVAILPNFYIKRYEVPRTVDSKTFISTQNTYFHARTKPKFSIVALIIAASLSALIFSKFNNTMLALITFICSMFAGMLALCDFEKKEVALTDNGVIISNFKVSILVPYDEIKEFRLGDSKATVGSIIVTFMSKTPFGNKIYFKPVVDLRETKRLLQLAGVRLEGGFNRV